MDLRGFSSELFTYRLPKIKKDSTESSGNNILAYTIKRSFCGSTKMHVANVS